MCVAGSTVVILTFFPCCGPSWPSSPLLQANGNRLTGLLGKERMAETLLSLNAVSPYDAHYYSGISLIF